MFEILNNPNEDEYTFITDKIQSNDWHCICKIDKTDDTHCPCYETWCRVEDEKPGFCQCGRYVVCERADLDKYKKENKG